MVGWLSVNVVCEGDTAPTMISFSRWWMVSGETEAGCCVKGNTLIKFRWIRAIIKREKAIIKKVVNVFLDLCCPHKMVGGCCLLRSAD